MLSGDGGWQVRDVDVEGVPGKVLGDAVLKAL